MRKTLIMSAVLAGALAVPGVSKAGFVNLTAEPFVGEGWVENGFDGLTAWRVYVNFDGGKDDGVLSVFGWTIESSDGDFHNAELDDLCPPEDLRKGGYWENQWDTYVAFGDPSLPGYFCPASDTWGEDTGWLEHSFACFCGLFLTPDDQQARAVDGRFFIGQFVVAAGETISGSLSTLLLLDGSQDGGEIATVTCTGDLDGNAIVEFADLLAVLAAWGNAGGPEDLDGSGTVDFGDILVVLGAWGPCK